MGHPVEPFDDEYEEGDECPACNDVIFHGKTPYFMKALFKDIEPCGGNPPTGVIPPIYLQQDPDLACVWSGWAKGGFIWFGQYWAVFNGWSKLQLFGPGGDLFDGIITENCQTSFINDFKCDEGDDYESGSGSVRWGRKVDEEWHEIW